MIHGTTATDNVTISVLTQADGRVRVEFNVKSRAGYDTDLVNRLSRAYEARMGRRTRRHSGVRAGPVSSRHFM